MRVAASTREDPSNCRARGGCQHSGRDQEAPPANPAPRERPPLQGRTRGGRQLAAGRVAVVGSLGQRSREYAVELLGQLGPELGDARRRLVQVREDDRELTLAVEGALAGEAFEEDAGK